MWKVTPTDLDDISPGIDPTLFHPWRLLLLCWLDMWKAGRVQIKAIDGWDRFQSWVMSSANRAFTLTDFCGNFARKASIPMLGTNTAEREYLAQVLALPVDEQRRVLKVIRNNTAVLLALIRLYQQKRHVELDALDYQDTEEVYDDAQEAY